MKLHNDEIKKQFNLRSSTFEQSVHWVRDPGLIAAHVRLAGPPNGAAVEVCCGTGAVARGLQAAGWNVTGVDISEGMVKQAQLHVRAVVGDASDLPFATGSADLAVMRQAYFLLNDGPAALREIRRILKPTGVLILSHLVPFSEVDRDHLQKVHLIKQAQMRKFHTAETLAAELQECGFYVRDRDFVVVRENVSLWMREAPELSESTRQEVCDMVLNAPEPYKRLRHVEKSGNDIFEDWNFVLLCAQPRI